MANMTGYGSVSLGDEETGGVEDLTEEEKKEIMVHHEAS